MAEPLDAYLTRRTGWTWAEVRRAIQRRRVTVRGVVCKRYHRQLDPGDAVVLDGAAILDGANLGTLVCHKPAGVACSHAPGDAPLIYDLVPESARHPNLQTAGRLDRDTTGLIILTIDGRFQIRLTAPGHALWKRYRIHYTGQLRDQAREDVTAGLILPDEPDPCLPARLTLESGGADGLGRATLEICEGRHHQVKRMIRTLGGQVVRLHRDRIGALDLPEDLAAGAMRALGADERALLLA
jgi:16S rRNA pseudouridine516 synthase